MVCWPHVASWLLGQDASLRSGRICCLAHTHVVCSYPRAHCMTYAKMVRVSKKGQFVIPKEIREALEVKEGETLLVRLEGKQAILSRARYLAQSTRGMLRGAWGGTKQR